MDVKEHYEVHCFYDGSWHKHVFSNFAEASDVMHYYFRRRLSFNVYYKDS